ncbi:hypothetical protein FJT64_018516 [Amphibalanus amphitrite]|uniref:Uncharacterized protein n=1 Tax=Amphibalanus amphitrite TaxID=1232801 RepID=A0A6A4WYW6_AMPAM|nr:hypothetical protein FJT64_018516 [Amphibalanus amphitrite]
MRCGCLSIGCHCSLEFLDQVAAPGSAASSDAGSSGGGSPGAEKPRAAAGSAGWPAVAELARRARDVRDALADAATRPRTKDCYVVARDSRTETVLGALLGGGRRERARGSRAAAAAGNRHQLATADPERGQHSAHV